MALFLERVSLLSHHCKRDCDGFARYPVRGNLSVGGGLATLFLIQNFLRWQDLNVSQLELLIFRGDSDLRSMKFHRNEVVRL